MPTQFPIENWKQLMYSLTIREQGGVLSITLVITLVTFLQKVDKKWTKLSHDLKLAIFHLGANIGISTEMDL